MVTATAGTMTAIVRTGVAAVATRQARWSWRSAVENFFPQVEEALIGMAVGDKKTITIKTVDAFGEYDAEQVSAVPRDQFPEDIDPQVGDTFELVNDDGDGMVVMVIEVDGKEITLDANHPLAGEDLIFELEMVEIN